MFNQAKSAKGYLIEFRFTLKILLVEPALAIGESQNPVCKILQSMDIKTRYIPIKK